MRLSYTFFVKNKITNNLPTLFCQSAGRVKYGNYPKVQLRSILDEESLNLDQRRLFVSATIAPDLMPMVLWQWRGMEGVISLTEARKRANDLFVAAAISENEGALFKGFLGIGQKGFGKDPKATAMAQKIIEITRKSRPPMPKEIEVIFGMKSQKGLIVVSYYGEPIEMEILAVQQHAKQLFQAAEAAESDAFFYHFLEERIGLPPEESNSLISEFKSFRDCVGLEDLFKQD